MTTENREGPCIHGFYYDCDSGCPDTNVVTIKQPEGVQVNDALIDAHGNDWIVTGVYGPKVIITPFGNRLHRVTFQAIGYIEAVVMKAEAESYAKEMAAQQEAEIRAETNIPQHLVW